MAGSARWAPVMTGRRGPSWVFGIFGDGTFGSLKGNIGDASVGPTGLVGTTKMDTAWAAGARVGYLVAPNVLSYVNGGYTGTYWSGSTLLDSNTRYRVGLHTDSFNTQGWFVGGGVENNLNIFGINAPGWFMKTEYRAAYLRQQEPRTNGSMAPTRWPVSTSPSSPSCRPSAPRWSTASTGVAADRREVLISANSAAQKPRHRPGLFCAWSQPRAAHVRPAEASHFRWRARLSHPVDAPQPALASRGGNARSATYDIPWINPAMTSGLAELVGIVFDPELRAVAGSCFPRQPIKPHGVQEPKAATEGNPWPDCCLIVGFLALAVGLLWIGQGTGAIAWPKSSFMINQLQWAGYGAAAGAVGLILIWQGNASWWKATRTVIDACSGTAQPDHSRTSVT